MSVIELCDKYLKQIPVELREKMERKLPNQKKDTSKFIKIYLKNKCILIKFFLLYLFLITNSKI